MAYPEKVSIVVKSVDLFSRQPYVLRLISREWARQGTRVDVTDRLGPCSDSETLVSHISLTTLPEPYRTYFAGHPHVVNGRVVDISKRRISRNRVLRPQDYDGPVVVKTSRNAGGWPDLRLKLKNRWVVHIASHVLAWLPFALTGLAGPENYPVYEHAWQVPWLAWLNPNLVIEKFRPERSGALYCLRQYTFLGDREVNTIAYGKQPIVKPASVVRREPLDAPPESLRELRRELGFDFGKFDYAISDGEVVLYDVNPTPTFADFNSEAARSIAAKLAPGIGSFLAAPAEVSLMDAQPDACV